MENQFMYLLAVMLKSEITNYMELEYNTIKIFLEDNTKIELRIQRLI